MSQVDRLWTTLPLVYSAHFTFIPYLNGSVSHISDLDHRMLLVFALQCCWSARLTYQSARRGFLDPCALRFFFSFFAFKDSRLFGLSVARKITDGP